MPDVRPGQLWRHRGVYFDYVVLVIGLIGSRLTAGRQYYHTRYVWVDEAMRVNADIDLEMDRESYWPDPRWELVSDV